MNPPCRFFPCLAALALLNGCGTAAPPRVTIGSCEYLAGGSMGALPFWEGPQSEEGGGGVRFARQSFAVGSTRGTEALVAEIWRNDRRLGYRAAVYSGAVSVLASDGTGNVIFFRRHLERAATGAIYDVNGDLLYSTDLRKGVAPRKLAIPAWSAQPGGTATTVCDVSGRLQAWVATKGGFVVRPALAGVGVASPVDAGQGGLPAAANTDGVQSPPALCTSDGDRTSLLYQRGSSPAVLEIHAGGSVERETLEEAWPTSVVMHAQGTLASFSARHRKSVLRVRMRGGPPRRFDLAGTVYAVTFWDERTLLVHLATGARDTATHISVAAVDAEKGAFAKLDLDFARAASDQAAKPDLSVLPEDGNGRPLLARLDNDLVLVGGTGDLWSWRAGNPACRVRP